MLTITRHKMARTHRARGGNGTVDLVAAAVHKLFAMGERSALRAPMSKRSGSSGKSNTSCKSNIFLTTGIRLPMVLLSSLLSILLLIILNMHEINLKVWLDDQAGDWSIEINGVRSEHVTSEILEDLVEVELIKAEKVLSDAAAAKRDREGTAPKPEKAPRKAKVLEFVEPQSTVEASLEAWVERLIQSNRALAAALTLLLDSHIALMKGEPVADAGELLTSVEDALRQAESVMDML